MTLPGCIWRTKPDMVNSQRVCANCVRCVGSCVGCVGRATLKENILQFTFETNRPTKIRIFTNIMNIFLFKLPNKRCLINMKGHCYDKSKVWTFLNVSVGRFTWEDRLTSELCRVEKTFQSY